MSSPNFSYYKNLIYPIFFIILWCDSRWVMCIYGVIVFKTTNYLLSHHWWNKKNVNGRMNNIAPSRFAWVFHSKFVKSNSYPHWHYLLILYLRSNQQQKNLKGLVISLLNRIVFLISTWFNNRYRSLQLWPLKKIQ